MMNGNHAFKQESAKGKVNEDYLRILIEEKSGWSIDGKNRNTDVGMKYTANYSDLKDELLSNLDKSKEENTSLISILFSVDDD